jgi:hypothetical protein
VIRWCLAILGVVLLVVVVISPFWIRSQSVHRKV